MPVVLESPNDIFVGIFRNASTRSHVRLGRVEPSLVLGRIRRQFAAFLCEATYSSAKVRRAALVIPNAVASAEARFSSHPSTSIRLIIQSADARLALAQWTKTGW